MNRHTKLLSIVLIAVLILFIVSIRNFYLDVEKSTQQISGEGEMQLLTKDSDNYRIYKNDDNKYGVKDPNGKIIIEPEWDMLYFIGDGYVGASKKSRNIITNGILNKDGNIVVPFIYEKLDYITDDLILGTLLNNNGYFLYDTKFESISDKPWDKYVNQFPDFVLYHDQDVFNYNLESSIKLEKLNLKRNDNLNSINLYCANPNILSQFTCKEWNEIADLVFYFLSACKRKDSEAVVSYLHENIRENLSFLELFDGDYNKFITISMEKSLVCCNVVFYIKDEEENTKKTTLKIKIEKENSAKLIITGLDVS